MLCSKISKTESLECQQTKQKLMTRHTFEDKTTAKALSRHLKVILIC